MFVLITVMFIFILVLPMILDRIVYEVTYRNRIVELHLQADNSSSFMVGGSTYLQLENVITQPNIQVLALYIKDSGLSFAQHQALRLMLERVQKSGKQIWVYLYSRERTALYLASIADKIYMFPTGSIFWMGLGGYHPFYKKLLDRFGLKADFERAGSYKSFAEPYMKETASQEYKEQYTSLLTSIQKQLLEGVATGRTLQQEDLQSLLSSSPIDAQKAKEVGLVDVLSYEDQFAHDLKEFTKSGSISLSTLSGWVRWRKRLNWYARSRPKIAVLHLRGAIHEQGDDGNRIIQSRVCQQLRSLKENDRIKAVVLLVNSPGGSALASEGILREVELLTREKPVVAFFSSVAASGGYYLSAMAGEIVALPGTITGSIGVVGGKLVVQEAAEKVGIHLEEISAGDDHNMFSFVTPFTEDQKARFQEFLMQTYERFLQVVSGGRGMPTQAVQKIAQGRVYTGSQALENGLVDKLGDLHLALERAKVRANLKTYEVLHVRTKISLMAKIRRQMQPLGRVNLPESLALIRAYSMVPLAYWPEWEDIELFHDHSLP